MSADHDPTEFVDGDFEAHKAPSAAASSALGQGQRAPTREEADSRVADAHQKLAELKRAQAELERERAALAETRQSPAIPSCPPRRRRLVQSGPGADLAAGGSRSPGFGRAARDPVASLNCPPSWHGLEKSQTRCPTARARSTTKLPRWNRRSK